MSAVWTKDTVRAELLAKDNWVERGVVAIFKKQTEDEQRVEQTNRDNGVGFTGVDAHLLSSFAKQLLRGRRLSDNQLRWARRKMLKYAKQLAKIANGKI